MTDTIRLELPPERQFHVVGRLVLGGLGSRVDMPVDRIDDLQLALDTMLFQGARDEGMVVELAAGDGEVSVACGPLRDGAGDDGSVRRVLAPLVDEVEAARRDGREWLVVRVRLVDEGP